MNALEAKAIFVKSDRELGFVNRAALEKAEQAKELEGIPGVSAVHFHHRRDKQTTIRSLSVLKEHRGQGWGRLLFYQVLCEQLPQILKQAKQIAPYCGRVLLIPKTKVPLPVFFWLAYSIQTSYGGTDIEPEWFRDRYVHLLGGSPNNQADSFRKFPKAVSLDGNYSSHSNVAEKGKSTWQGYEGRVVKGCYPSFQLSIEMQRRYWHKDYECPYCLLRPSKCLACFNSLR